MIQPSLFSKSQDRICSKKFLDIYKFCENGIQSGWNLNTCCFTLVSGGERHALIVEDLQSIKKYIVRVLLSLLLTSKSLWKHAMLRKCCIKIHFMNAPLDLIA